MEETPPAKTVYQPPAISPAEPIPPSENAKPFPTPFSSNNPLFSSNNTSENVMEKFPLNKVQDGRIHKRKKKSKMMKYPAINMSKDFVNAKLRRKIYPKNPVMILRELALELNTEEIYTYPDSVDEEIEGQTMKLFPCEVQFNGGIFSGSAPDPEISRMLAAENAIQAYTVSAVNGGPPNVETSDPLDNAPWAALASLGLFKLFNDWQDRGFLLPLNTFPAPMGKGRVVKEEISSPIKPVGVMKACKNMPENPTSKHPVSLLNEVYPGTPMTCTINPQGDMFQMSATIDGKTFVGVGRNKKDAKKFCAMDALKELLNIEYPKSG